MTRPKTAAELPRHSAWDHERDLGAGAVKSAKRAFEIIEFFEQFGKPATTADIVAATGLPQSSTSMLLRTLTRMGYLCWNQDSRTYVPSLRLHMLGGWVHDVALPRSHLRLAMQELSRRTGLSVVLGQRTGRFVQYAHVVFASSTRDDDVPIGVVRSLVDTGSGYALMAALPDKQVLRIATACLAQAEQRHVVRDVEEVMEMVATVRRLGFAYSVRLQNTGKASLSFSLSTARGASPESSFLALSLAGRRSTLDAGLTGNLEAINDIAKEFLPDAQICLDPCNPMESI